MPTLEPHPPLASLSPLVFSLRDPAVGQAVLYLGGPDQTFEIEVQNLGEKNLVLGDESDPAPEPAICLTLFFRPGVLANTSQITLGPDSNGWRASARVATAGEADEGSAVVAFRRTAGPLVLAPGEGTKLALRGLHANPGQGAAHSYVRFEYKARLQDGTQLNGAREYPVAVLHLTQSALHGELEDLKKKLNAVVVTPGTGTMDGRLKTLEEQLEKLRAEVTELVNIDESIQAFESLPLTADIVGPATVFADGKTECDLKLRVTNISGETLRLAEAPGAPTAAAEGPPITIRFTEWDEKGQPWGVVAPDKLDSIDPLTVRGEGWREGWRLEKKEAGLFSLHLPALEADESIEVTFKRVTGARSVGRAHVQIGYQNIGKAAQYGSQIVVVDRSTLRASDDEVSIRRAALIAEKGARIEGDKLVARAGAVVQGGGFEAKEDSVFGKTAQIKGSLFANGYVEVGDRLFVQETAQIEGTVYANAGASVIGDFHAGNGATVEGGPLIATNGARISGGPLTAGAGATVEGGELIANQGLSVHGGELVADFFASETRDRMARPSIKARSIQIGAFFIEPADWLGLKFRCSYARRFGQDADLETAYTLNANWSHVKETRELIASKPASPNGPPQLFRTESYTVPNNGSIRTNYKASEWVPAVIGFNAGRGDLDEDGAGELVKCYCTVADNGMIEVRACERTHGAANTWTVWVLFIHKPLVNPL